MIMNRPKVAWQFLISRFLADQGRGRRVYADMLKESDADMTEICNKKSVMLLFIYDASAHRYYLPGKQAQKGCHSCDSPFVIIR